MADPLANAETIRLAAADAGEEPWRRWGPYVAERAWGGVREDYSADGDAWASFPFDHAVSRAYRWNEDGLSAWSDDQQRLCLGIALWNGYDAVLKERYFGLAGPQGNHGEDAKDYWWYCEATPTHSYQRNRYAYPLSAFPYDRLVAENASRDRSQPEFELIDTGIFADENYVMVTSEWAKAGPADICLVIDVENRSATAARIHVLPTAWFRNTWSWDEPPPSRPRLWADGDAMRGHHDGLGEFVVRSVADRYTATDAGDRLLFCDNDTNVRKLYGADVWAERPAAPFPKDGINDNVVHGAHSVNPDREGTKAAFHHVLDIPPHEHRHVRVRLTIGPETDPAPAVGDPAWGAAVDSVINVRRTESEAYWRTVFARLAPEQAHVARQAMAGLLCSKQYYDYDVRRWLAGDPAQPKPPDGHAAVRNAAWPYLVADDVILMPDPWEYPWFAAWDLAYHCMALALVDPQLAKRQLLLLLGERYMHPSGDIPAYEWNLSDTNPPVHAWAALQIFYIDGATDTDFLERAMHKLLLNFTWWVNRKDTEGNNLFEGGFLGLDNIGAFDRSTPLPDGAVYEQSDGTAWMAMYCLDMLRIALTLARRDHTYDDLAVKFFTHFCYIASAADDLGLWDASDGFFYDQLRLANGATTSVKIRSVVGLMPLAAVTQLDDELTASIPSLAARLAWMQDRRPEVMDMVRTDADGTPRLLAMVRPEQLPSVLRTMLDPAEFLSDHGLRSMSAVHRDHPASVAVDGQVMQVDYEPAESRTPLFGGNSNWRGPVWFPVNALLISALRRFAAGGAEPVEFPTGSGVTMPLGEIADALAGRLMTLFVPGPDGVRPCQRGLPWQDDVLFNEYFHGDTGAGLGASHQTGWTAMIALLALGLPN
mgnify:CR=1 FL=1